MTDIDNSNRLPVLAAQINEAHDRTLRAAKATLESAIAAGERLAEAKGLLKHGQWLPWLRQNCDLSDRVAQSYMRLARHKDRLKGKYEVISDLTIATAIEISKQPGLPLKGFGRLWQISETASQDYIFIEESADNPGFYFATRIMVPQEGKAFTDGMRRPVRSDYVFEVIRQFEDAPTLINVPFVDVPEEAAREIRKALAASPPSVC